MENLIVIYPFYLLVLCKSYFYSTIVFSFWLIKDPYDYHYQYSYSADNFSHVQYVAFLSFKVFPCDVLNKRQTTSL